MYILGIDPGYDRIGVGIIEHQPTHGKEVVIFSTCIHTKSRDPFYKRLMDIQQAIQGIVRTYPISYAGIEKLYFAKNTKTALSVAEARGVIGMTLYAQGIPLYDIEPNQIKITITGYGKATKQDIAFMIPKITQGISGAEIDDQLDAIAVAVTTRITQHRNHI